MAEDKGLRLVNYWDRQEGKDWVCYNGHAYLVLQGLEDNTVDFVLTDPPYGTGANSVAGRSLGNKVRQYISESKHADFVDSFLPEGWALMMSLVFGELFRIVKEGGQLLVFSDWRALPSLLSVVNSCGFTPLHVAVWDKGRGARPMPNQFRRQSEFILHLVKGKQKQKAKPVYLDGVIQVPAIQNTEKLHAVQKPTELLSYLLQLAEDGSHVLDPFQGVGSTGIACLRRGLRYTGIEIVPEFHRLACERLRQIERQGGLYIV